MSVLRESWSPELGGVPPEQWEQSAVYYLEASDHVVAYAKNQGVRILDAVNTDGSFGEWRYEMAHDMSAIPRLLVPEDRTTDSVARSS